MVETLDTRSATSGNGDVLAEVLRMLEPFRKEGAPIAAETDIAAELNLDSLAVMNLLMDVEDRFDVSIPLNVVPEIRTVGDLAKAIKDAKENA